MKLKMVFGIFLILVVATSGCLSAFGREPKPELCNQVADQRQKAECFHRVAVRTGNSTYCTVIADLQIKDFCFSDLAEGNTWASGGGFD